jgi:hypothetical protein
MVKWLWVVVERNGTCIKAEPSFETITGNYVRFLTDGPIQDWPREQSGCRVHKV